MRRAQSMAQAAWTRPSLKLSSWSCMGPRHRASAARPTSKEGDSPEPSRRSTAEPLISSPKKSAAVAALQNLDCPVSSSVSMEWTPEIEPCSPDDHSNIMADLHTVDDDELIGRSSHENSMSEVELWQQLEHELYERTEGEEDDVEKEIREEEAAAIAEVGEDQPDSSPTAIKEVHRFFPPGKILHIVTFHPEPDSDSDSPTSSNSDTEDQPEDAKVAIFLTPRKIYSKLRLSQTMVSDHFMPVYRRQIEKLITELENEQAPDHHER